MLRKTRAEGQGAVAKQNAINGEDLMKFYSHEFVFKVVFEIMFYFCRTGQENQHNLCVQDLEVRIQMDKNMSKNDKSELTKNHQGTTRKRKVQGQRMYATESVIYRVKSFEKYLYKRHTGTDRLFLHSKNNSSYNDPVWYRTSP